MAWHRTGENNYCWQRWLAQSPCVKSKVDLLANLLFIRRIISTRNKEHQSFTLHAQAECINPEGCAMTYKSIATVLTHYPQVTPYGENAFVKDGPDNGLLPGGTEKLPESTQVTRFMGPTWVMSAPDGPHVGPMNIAIRECWLKGIGMYCIAIPQKLHKI